MHKQIDKIIRSKSCLGCGLCISEESKDGMKIGADGFLHPSPKAQIKSDFLHYCPGVRIIQNKSKNNEEIIYGPMVSPVLAGWSTNPDIRHQASSGGVITQLLLALFKYNEIDAVLHTTQSPDNPIETIATLSLTEKEIIACKGSRYAPCSLFENLHKILKQGYRLAVVGKPCDISGLKAYMATNPKYTANIKYTFSIMCMGLPSQNATIELVNLFGINPTNVSSLRYRGYGWPGEATIADKIGNLYRCSYIESWGAILGRNTLFRCKLCPNGFGEFADITCGDAWFCKNGDPVFDNKCDGRSLIFQRSEKGYKLVNKAIEDHLIEVEEYDLSEISLIQKSQYQRKVNLLFRYLFFKMMINHSFKIKGFHLMKLARVSGLRNLIIDARGFIGRYWRDYKGNHKYKTM